MSDRSQRGFASGSGPQRVPGAVIERYGDSVVRQVAVIDMRPFGKARPRVTRNGTYMESGYRRKKRALRRAFGEVQVEGLIKLIVVAVRPMPAAWGAQRRRMMAGEPAGPTPDLDNIVGAVMDALFPNGDSRIVSLEAHKIWGERGQLQIAVEKMGDT